MFLIDFEDYCSLPKVAVSFGAAWLLEERHYARQSVGLPELFYASAGHLLYGGELAAYPPLPLLLDKQPDLQIAEFQP